MKLNYYFKNNLSSASQIITFKTTNQLCASKLVFIFIYRSIYVLGEGNEDDLKYLCQLYRYHSISRILGYYIHTVGLSYRPIFQSSRVQLHSIVSVSIM